MVLTIPGDRLLSACGLSTNCSLQLELHLGSQLLVLLELLLLLGSHQLERFSRLPLGDCCQVEVVVILAPLVCWQGAHCPRLGD